MSLLIDTERDTEYAHFAEGFETIAHVFDESWHGIRAACGALPGHKIAISHRSILEVAELDELFGFLEAFGINTLIYQGFSRTTHVIAQLVRSRYADAVRQHIVFHVSPAQFEHTFEMDMLGACLTLSRHGIIDRIGSVKPGFNAVANEISPVLLINAAPRVQIGMTKRDVRTAFVPLENTWRKNLYVNIIACNRAPGIKRIIGVNDPTHMAQLEIPYHFERTPFLSKRPLYSLMSSVGLVMNVTLIECQPMTQLEAFAVGTPCLSGPLNLPIEPDEASRLFEVPVPDDLTSVTQYVNRVCGLWSSDPDALSEIIVEHRDTRNRLSIQSYRAFLA